MNKDRFDFLEIDVAIPAAEKMQQEDRTAVVLENNCKVVGILNEKVEKLENRLAEALSAPDETVSSFHKASRVTVGEDSRRVLEQEGDAICRKTTEMIGKEGKKLMDRLSMRDRTIVSTVVFWCMVETVVFLLATFICTCMVNAQFIHNTMLGKMLGCGAGFLLLCIGLTAFVCHKLKL